MSLERDLLFCVFAVQLGMARSEQLSRAAGAWAADRSGSLRERLIEVATLSEKDAHVVSEMVQIAVRTHGGSVARTLRSIGGATDLPESVLADVDVRDALPGARLLSFGGESEPEESSDPGCAMESAEAPTAEGSSTPTDALEVTQEQVGRYESGDDVLGEGGIGRVLLTFDRHLGREVARKELHTRQEAGTTSSITGQMLRFVREARVTGQLEHPNIVPVYELGCRADNTLYYTMKIVRGRTLGEALAACESLRERLKLLGPFQRVCDALAYAHSRGVVHRDLKPDNIMLGEFGETVVVDWGLAKVAGEDDLRGREIARQIVRIREAASGNTVEGRAIGTPAYMSPEQADGDIEAIDERSDTWGLGAILYEILTGNPPFEGVSPFEIIGKVMRESAQPVRSKAPDAPADLAAIADRALLRDRDARYQRAADLAEDVAAWESGRNVGVYSYSSMELARRFVRRNPVATAAAGVAALSLIVGSALVYRAYGQAERARADAVSEREQARSNERVAQDAVTESFLEKARRALKDADPAAAAIFAANALVQDPSNPNGPHYMKPEGGEPEEVGDRDHRTAERIAWAYSLHDEAVGLRSMRFVHDLELGGVGAHGHIVQVSPSPDGRRVAWLTQSGRVGVHSIDGSEPLRIIEEDSARGSGESFLGGPRGVSVAWTPDGAQVAFVEGRVVRWMAVDTGAEVRHIDVGSAATACALSPDGARVATSHTDGSLRLWSVPDAEQLWAVELAQHPLGQVRWAESAERLLVMAGGEAHIVDAAKGGDVVSQAMTATALFGWISPDGKRAATATRSGVAYFFDDAGERHRYDAGERLHELDVSDGGRLLIGGSTTSAYLFDFASLAPRERLHGAHRDFFALAWIGDGVVAGGKRRAIRVFASEPTHWRSAVVELGFRVGARALSADGTTMWVGSANGAIYRVALTDGRKHQITDVGSSVTRLLRSPDGKRLVATANNGTVTLFDIENGYVRRVLRGSSGASDRPGVAFSPDGRIVLHAGPEFTVQRYDIVNDAHLEPMRGHRAHVRVILAVNDTVISGSGDGVLRFTPFDGAEAVERKEHEGLVSGLDASPDGKIIASSGLDTVIRIWDLASKTVVRRLRGHTRWVNRVRFSPDGRFLLSASDDGTARLWDVASWRLLHIFRVSDEAVWLNWSPDSKHVYLDGGKQVLRFRLTVNEREYDPRELLAKAQRAAGVELHGLELRAPGR